MTLDRREFLQTTALGGLAAAVGAAPLRAAPKAEPEPASRYGAFTCELSSSTKSRSISSRTA